MTKALVCSVNSNASQRSSLQKLYGDPDDYAYKFGNDTFEYELPIYHAWIYYRDFDYFHSISIDYSSQRVYYSNHVYGQLQYGMFVYENTTSSYYYGDVPNTNQVTKR